MQKIELSIVILNYNSCDVLIDCLKSLNDSVGEIKFEVIVVDNFSTDNSLEKLKEIKTKYKIIIVENNLNLGFAKGNNSSRKFVNGEHVLFLNPDTIISKNVLSRVRDKFLSINNIGAITCKLVKLDGSLDLDARRSFPTPWVSLTHFSKIDRLFPHSKLFSKYWYGYISEDETHEIDSLEGAFCYTSKKVLDKINWFDEDYFLDGEDIDLCWKIKNAKFKIIYFPEVSIVHIKGVSKGKKETGIKRKISDRRKYIISGMNSMKIFYRKRLWNQYPFYINFMVLFAIEIMTYFRIIKLYF